MVLLELPIVAKWAIVVIIYVFTLVLLLVMMGTFSQHLKLPQKLSPRELNILVIGTAMAAYLLIVFYFLNDWAREMIFGYY